MIGENSLESEKINVYFFPQLNVVPIECHYNSHFLTSFLSISFIKNMTSHNTKASKSYINYFLEMN